MFSKLKISDTNRRRPTKKYVTFTPIPLGQIAEGVFLNFIGIKITSIEDKAKTILYSLMINLKILLFDISYIYFVKIKKLQQIIYQMKQIIKK